ncbi:MAG: UDP diphospho-muramoyl pentapeptide beta-N acetylglucosaminyl transferase [Parcubacteria group bacterium GW2011_GWA2_47_7]|nr:MAG: UDP diphospho-muramoyl pentapeptide beta-N acetylglucosaminyl transferase [Parcubacteria group bacterium GW2011_GWA2_47_7]
MRILFAGGGTGGHFYPIIAVAEAVNELTIKDHLLDIDLVYMSDAPFDSDMLKRTHISFVGIVAGKRRTYFSIQNFIDPFKTIFGCILAVFKLFALYPDVVFGKGGYASFPTVFAAKLLRIPVVIHESDIVPGKVNRWIGSYAEKVAISYPEAAKYFPHQDRIAYTGQPIRKAILDMPPEDPIEALGLEPGVPVILVIGGSQGAGRINENIIDILPRLLEKCQIVHQTGEKNLDWMKQRAAAVLPNNPNANRYHPFATLESTGLRLAAKAASLVISRAGSGIFEIAIWQKPSILIPLPIARDDHQRENAYSYARTGACTVIEETNLKPELFFSVIDSIMSDKDVQQKMIDGSRMFTKPDAAEKIAQALLSIATKH